MKSESADCVEIVKTTTTESVETNIQTTVAEEDCRGSYLRRGDPADRKKPTKRLKDYLAEYDEQKRDLY